MIMVYYCYPAFGNKKRVWEIERDLQFINWIKQHFKKAYLADHFGSHREAKSEICLKFLSMDGHLSIKSFWANLDPLGPHWWFEVIKNQNKFDLIEKMQIKFWTQQWEFEHFSLSSPIRANLWKIFMYGQDSNLIFRKDTVMIIMSGYIMQQQP